MIKEVPSQLLFAASSAITEITKDVPYVYTFIKCFS